LTSSENPAGGSKPLSAPVAESFASNGTRTPEHFPVLDRLSTTAWEKICGETTATYFASYLLSFRSSMCFSVDTLYKTPYEPPKDFPIKKYELHA
jgi:hypothetical protein